MYFVGGTSLARRDHEALARCDADLAEMNLSLLIYRIGYMRWDPYFGNKIAKKSRVARS